MVTANLSRALQGTVTSVAVGKDVISRTGTITFERLLDQVGELLGHPLLCSAMPVCVAVCDVEEGIALLGRYICCQCCQCYPPPCLRLMLLQMVLALARTRLPKARVLLNLWSRTLRDKPLQELFRPVEEIPPEALSYLRQ
jgi:hypothetical protein